MLPLQILNINWKCINIIKNISFHIKALYSNIFYTTRIIPFCSLINDITIRLKNLHCLVFFFKHRFYSVEMSYMSYENVTVITICFLS